MIQGNSSPPLPRGTFDDSASAHLNIHNPRTKVTVSQSQLLYCSVMGRLFSQKTRVITICLLLHIGCPQGKGVTAQFLGTISTS